MITERTLKRWRKEALAFRTDTTVQKTAVENELNDRILRMTAELLDQHLIRKE